MKPAAPTPTPATSCSARSSATAPATPASSSSGSVAGVLRAVVAMIHACASTTPAAGLVPPPSTPRPAPSRPARRSATASATPASRSSGSVAGVLRVVVAMLPPCSSTTPAAILVPPMSTPMESMLWCSFRLEPACRHNPRSPAVESARPHQRFRPAAPDRRPPPARIEGDSMKQFGTAAQHVSREDENTTDMLLERLRTHPSIPIFERADGSGSYTPVEMADFITEVKTVAKGLIASGLETGDAVAILSRTRYEWALADWAIWWVGGVSVPIYETSSPSQIQWIASDSSIRFALVEAERHAEDV